MSDISSLITYSELKQLLFMSINTGRKCYTRDGVLMITCQGVFVITVTEFVGKLLYILQKHSSEMVIFIFKK
jgi:hypothetical protein